MKTIDINCDIGEEQENEAQLMPYISSCNISCGGHAGSISTIDESIKTALKYKVKIGAHPSFVDVKNFGRKVLKISDEVLQESIEKQLLLFQNRLNLTNGKLHHIKAHGALYNLSAIDKNIARVFVRAVKNTTNDAFLYVPYGSEIEKEALQNNVKVIYEAFADRNYNEDLTLVSRADSNAVITDKKKVFEHLYQMITTQNVATISGKEIPIKATTFCIHGDNPKVIEVLSYVTDRLQKEGIQIC